VVAREGLLGQAEVGEAVKKMAHGDLRKGGDARVFRGS
jgi:hypothetical protein